MPAQPATTAAVRALITDDDRDGADSLAMLLEAQGHEAKALYRATDLIREAVSFRPDIIFLDIFIPYLSGISAARRIRQDPALRGVWLVALTGSPGTVELRDAFAAGFDAYYLKPIDAPALSALLTLSSQERSAIGFIMGPKMAHRAFSCSDMQA